MLFVIGTQHCKWNKTNMFYYRLLDDPCQKKLSDYKLPFEFQLKWHNEWSLYLDLPFHLAKVLQKAAFQQKFLRRHKSRPDFVRFWCSSFGYSMQQLFIIKQKGMQNINHIYLYYITFYISIYFHINPLLKFRVIETKTRV